jgi:hypothetical protein
MSRSSGDSVARNKKRTPESGVTRTWSQAVTTATPAKNGSTDHSRSAISDSPTTELVIHARRLKSSWLFGTYGPASISRGPARTKSATVTISSCQ